MQTGRHDECIALYYDEIKDLRAKTMSISIANNNILEIIGCQMEQIAEMRYLVDSLKMKKMYVEGEAAASEQLAIINECKQKARDAQAPQYIENLLEFEQGA